MGANTGQLKKANSDAQALADAIQKRFNVPVSNTCVLENVTREDFFSALKRLQELALKSDTDKVYLYFSGHGAQVEDKNNDEGCYDEAFVIFPDVGKIPFFVRDDSFVKQVNKIDANMIIIIDSCFAGGMLRGTRNCSDMKSKLYDKTVNLPPERGCPSSEIKRLKGTVYMASGEYQLAWEDANGGVFTTSLIDNMRKFPQATLDEIFDITAEQVAEQTKKINCARLQKPQRQH